MEREGSGVPLDTISVDYAQGHVCRITLKRPRVRNALRSVDCVALRDALRDAESRSAVAVIEGSGSHFCAGADLTEVLAEDPHVRTRCLDSWSALLLSIVRLSVPVIVVVRGSCVGGGHQLHLVSDVTLADTSALFRQTGTDVGIVPSQIGTFLFGGAVGWKRALSYVLTADSYDAAKAVAMGLCAQACEPDELGAVVDAWVERLCGADPVAVGAVKQMVRYGHKNVVGALDLASALGHDALDNASARANVKKRLGWRSPSDGGAA